MDGTGLTWFLENTPTASLTFLLFIGLALAFWLVLKHERKCESLRQEQVKTDASFRKEVRSEFGKLHEKDAEFGASLGRIEGYMEGRRGEHDS